MIENKCYEQKELFIGSPTSPSFTEIKVKKLEEVSIYTTSYAPKLWL